MRRYGGAANSDLPRFLRVGPLPLLPANCYLRRKLLHLALAHCDLTSPLASCLSGARIRRLLSLSCHSPPHLQILLILGRVVPTIPSTPLVGALTYALAAIRSVVGCPLSPSPDMVAWGPLEVILGYPTERPGLLRDLAFVHARILADIDSRWREMWALVWIWVVVMRNSALFRTMYSIASPASCGGQPVERLEMRRERRAACALEAPGSDGGFLYCCDLYSRTRASYSVTSRWNLL